MKQIRIKSLLSGYADISFIEFIIDGKTKILSTKNFINRYGDYKQYIK
jgi:hypothetical protein